MHPTRRGRSNDKPLNREVEALVVAIFGMFYKNLFVNLPQYDRKVKNIEILAQTVDV
jgi:hypothetical protein